MFVKPRRSGNTEDLIYAYIRSSMAGAKNYIVCMNETCKTDIYFRIKDKIRYRNEFEREIYRESNIMNAMFNRFEDSILTIGNVNSYALRGRMCDNIFIDEVLPQEMRLLMEISYNIYFYTGQYISKKTLENKYDILKDDINITGIRITSKLTKENKCTLI